VRALNYRRGQDSSDGARIPARLITNSVSAWTR
jgi:hypothetical protein